MSSPPVGTSFLTPKTQTFLENLPVIEDWSKVDLQQMRNAPREPIDPAIPAPEVTIQRIKIPVLNDDHYVQVDVYRPKDVSAQTILPGLVYLHGGGFTFGAGQGHELLASKLCGEANCTVFLVHYSLSPEVKFPVALEECYSVVAYVCDPITAQSLYVNPERIAVGGDSAGGNLTAALTLLAKQRNNLKNSIKYQILYYPTVEYQPDNESYRKYGKGYMLTREATRYFDMNYDSESAKDSILRSPGLATREELMDLPPALLVVAEADVLRCEGENYGHKLLKAGVPVTSLRVNGVIHGFMSILPVYDDGTISIIDMTTAALRRVFHS